MKHDESGLFEHDRGHITKEMELELRFPLDGTNKNYY